jgi:glycosyltransferase involved in cell wall biosynthesis
MDDYPFVSVIIPVFNDLERLQHCLAALAQQTYRRSHYEIIVVDNGSDHPEQVQTAAAPYHNVKVVEEPTPGSYAARNQGITLAAGTIIAFTDADCLPAPDWLAQGVHCLRATPNCGQVVGRVQLFFANPQAPNPIELYESVTAFPQEQLLQQFHGGATANLFTWRQVIDQVGVFNPQLKSYGDLEWGQRVHTQGYHQVYADQVVVAHPGRRSWQELSTRTRRLAGGYYDFQLQRAHSWIQRQWVFLRTLLQNLVPPVFFMINTLLDARLTGLGPKLQVSWIMVLVRYVSAWETLRLKLGGLSVRK